MVPFAEMDMLSELCRLFHLLTLHIGLWKFLDVQEYVRKLVLG
jgi:hypothetical protein